MWTISRPEKQAFRMGGVAFFMKSLFLFCAKFVAHVWHDFASFLAPKTLPNQHKNHLCKHMFFLLIFWLIWGRFGAPFWHQKLKNFQNKFKKTPEMPSRV